MTLEEAVYAIEQAMNTDDMLEIESVVDSDQRGGVEHTFRLTERLGEVAIAARLMEIQADLLVMIRAETKAKAARLGGEASR